MAKLQIDATQLWSGPHYRVSMATQSMRVSVPFDLAPLPALERKSPAAPSPPSAARKRGPGGCGYLPAHEPQHDKHNQDDAEDAAETGAAVATVCIISPASAEDEDQDYDKENCAHISACGQVRVVWNDAFTVSSPRRASRRSDRRRCFESCRRPCRSCRRFAAWRRRSLCRRPLWRRL